MSPTWAAAALLLAGAWPSAADSGARRRELRRLERDLEATRREISELESSEREQSQGLRALESRESESGRRLSVLRESLREARGRERRIEAGLGDLARAGRSGRKALGRGLDRLARERAASEDAFGTAGLRREAYRRRLILAQAGGLGRLDSSRRELARVGDRIRRDVRSLEGTGRTLEAERERGRRERLEAQDRLDETRRRREAAALRARELEETARELTRLLDRLKRPSRPGPAVARRSLPWPAAGRVVEGFGRRTDPELGTVVIRQGLTLETEPGAEVRSVRAGRVIFAGDFRSYGLVVIIDHGGLHSVYGELGAASVRPGRRVSEREVVGRAGGGASRGTLYLELREGGRAVDPLELLGAKP